MMADRSRFIYIYGSQKAQRHLSLLYLKVSHALMCFRCLLIFRYLSGIDRRDLLFNDIQV